MRRHIARVAAIMVAFVVVGPLAPWSAAAQSGAPAWTAPRTPDGHPDLQGVWEHNVATPLERPEAWEGKASLSPEELAEIQAAAAVATDPGKDALFGDQLIQAAIAGTEATSYDPTTGNYNQFWIADRFFSTQTSLVVDPPSGRIPDVTPEAAARRSERGAYRDAHPADTYTDRPLSERCVSYGVPRIGAGYNSYYQVVQTKDHVAILQEMIHDVRVIPIDGPGHAPESVRFLHGDSRGHYEGDTLVVVTKNYAEGGGYRGATTDLTVTERFTRVDPETLQYEVRFEDEATWTAPWSVSIPLRSTQDAIYEYACHEGNIGMEGILAGHRFEERAAER